MNNLSYWEKETYFSQIDFAIIGSGIVGLCTAIELKTKFPKKNITIFERGFLPSGASTKNAGFACFGSVSEIYKDLEQFTENEVYSLIEKRWKGLQKLKSIIGENALGYENVGGYEIFTNESQFEKYQEFLPKLNAACKEIIGKNVYQLADNKIDSFGFRNVGHIIFNQYEGTVHTGKMMQELIQKAQNLGIIILNGIEVKKIESNPKGAYIYINDNECINVKKVLVATNAFAKSLLPNLDLIPGRGQVIVTKPIENLQVKGAFHFEAGYFYFRNVGNRILLGGGRNLDFKAEETTNFGSTQLVQKELKRLLTEVILPQKNFEIDYGWSGIMAFGSQQAPIIQQVSDNIFAAVKCQGMGVALGALVAEEAVQLISETI